MTKSKKIRRAYAEEFKRDAVNMVVEQGHSIAEVERNLGICVGLLGKWKKKLAQSDSIDVTAMKLELKKLRKENKRLEMKREILKKAAAFFASELK